ncbi:DDE-type integrase/transposase/recombinase [Methylotenera mobilis]|uniref:DDE-type integrase/transposase/recombinase n=1 Tax=Methylotenera mobilis TaxID=359408 RepID=UPI00036B6EF1|nr:DDE-type integrase/transposase/recombinase [Methylotenera mobilis]
MTITNDNSAKKIFSKTSKEKLKILNIAKKPSYIEAICYEENISVSTFYNWKRDYEQFGLLGLERKKSGARKRESNVIIENRDQVILCSIQNPDFGCCKIADKLKSQGISISSPTIQKILKREGIENVSKRLFKLEEKHIKEGWLISDFYLKLINKNNPCLKHRNEIGSYPGEILVQDTILIFENSPKDYVYVVIDTYSNYVFSYPYKEKSAEMAIDLLKVKALRFFRERNFKVKKILTSKGREFCKFDHLYSNFLISENIEHVIYSGNLKNWHGFISRYKQDFLPKFNKISLKDLSITEIKETISQMTNDASNASKAKLGFPAFGDSPANIVNNTMLDKSNISRLMTRRTRLD